MLASRGKREGKLSGAIWLVGMSGSQPPVGRNLEWVITYRASCHKFISQTTLLSKFWETVSIILLRVRPRDHTHRQHYLTVSLSAHPAGQ